MLPSISMESFERLKFISQIAATWLVPSSLQTLTFNAMFSFTSGGNNDDMTFVQGLGEQGSTGWPSGPVDSKHRNDFTVVVSSVGLTSTLTGAYKTIFIMKMKLT